MTSVIIVIILSAIALIWAGYNRWIAGVMHKAYTKAESSYKVEYNLENLQINLDKTPWWHFRARHDLIRRINRL